MATAVPSWVGRTPSSWVMPGVRRYIETSEPEKPASARPATFVGTKGSRSEAPTAISPQLRNFANCSGVSLPSAGTPCAAMPRRCSAVPASMPSLPMPEFRMNAPGTARRRAVLRAMGRTFRSETT